MIFTAVAVFPLTVAITDASLPVETEPMPPRCAPTMVEPVTAYVWVKPSVLFTEIDPMLTAVMVPRW